MSARFRGLESERVYDGYVTPRRTRSNLNLSPIALILIFVSEINSLALLVRAYVNSCGDSGVANEWEGEGKRHSDFALV
jgi:hypothetical protein